MQKVKLTVLFLLSGIFAQSQSYLSTSGGTLTDNLKINGTDAAWAENLLLIKPTGWGGLRFSRRDPSTGNYDGNWAIGYNASTNNDFSISSSYQGTQYDYLFHISAATRNIGIGTSAPDQRLTIKGGGIGFDGNSADKKLYSPADGTLEWMTHDAAGEHGFAVSHQGQKRVFLNTSGNSYLMGGNVGIGTTNPTERLSIAGNLFLTGQRSEIYGTDRNHMIVLRGRQDGTIIDETNYYQYGDHVFNTGGPVAGQTEKMRIKANGNVLIGKNTQTNPTYKLDVAGNIRADKLVVNTTGADFVFDPGYQLPTLTEVEKYINSNKHLPGIESAKEMATNGLNVGEIQTKLLQKIEELTLYMIEMKKENNEMKQENIFLRKRIENLENKK